MLAVTLKLAGHVVRVDHSFARYFIEVVMQSRQECNGTEPIVESDKSQEQKLRSRP